MEVIVTRVPAKPLTANDLKKGTRIQLKNGWYATLMDNRKGGARLAMVEGVVTEAGSVYASNIMRAEIDGRWLAVTETEALAKGRKAREAIGL